MPLETEKEFDRYAGNYQDELHRGLKVTGESSEYYANERMRWTRKRLANLSFRPKRVLDFGCGTGGSIGLLLGIDGVTEVVGMDPSSESIKIARANFQDNPKAHFFTAAEINADEQFDLIFCNGVFHHIPPGQRDGAIKSIYRWLRPGGVFALWENNRWNPGTRYVMSRIPFDCDAITLSGRGARRLVRTSGLNVLGSDFLFYFPRSLSWFRKIEPLFCKVPLGGQFLILAQRGE